MVRLPVLCLPHPGVMVSCVNVLNPSYYVPLCYVPLCYVTLCPVQYMCSVPLCYAPLMLHCVKLLLCSRVTLPRVTWCYVPRVPLICILFPFLFLVLCSPLLCTAVICPPPRVVPPCCIHLGSVPALCSPVLYYAVFCLSVLCSHCVMISCVMFPVL